MGREYVDKAEESARIYLDGIEQLRDMLKEREQEVMDSSRVVFLETADELGFGIDAYRAAFFTSLLLHSLGEVNTVEMMHHQPGPEAQHAQLLNGLIAAGVTEGAARKVLSYSRHPAQLRGQQELFKNGNNR